MFTRTYIFYRHKKMWHRQKRAYFVKLKYRWTVKGLYEECIDEMSLNEASQVDNPHMVGPPVKINSWDDWSAKKRTLFEA